ncbi:phage/plasmid primase, P4 family [Streptomyces sp. NPDC088847]|uniref:phage/plasmid primase, P4 family n=1 Tax=Streptomyces sp. NPDC088847 TaxID=3365909 RepID=UPI0038305A80
MTTALESRILSASNGYFERGWKVQPLSENKVPVARCQSCIDVEQDDPKNYSHHMRACPCIPAGLACHSFYAASDDPAIVTGWLTQYPGMNLAIATGRVSGIFVFEYDPKNGGKETFDALVDEHGEMPNTYTVMSPSGGLHFYFAYPDFDLGQHLSLFPGTDVKADWGYVGAPPTPNYMVINNAPVAPAPDWLLAALRAKEDEKCATPRGEFRTFDPDNIPQDISDGVQNLIKYRVDWIVKAPDGVQNIRIYTVSRMLHSVAYAGLIDEDDVYYILMDAADAGGHPAHRAKSAIESGRRMALADPDPIDGMLSAGHYFADKDLFTCDDFGNADRVTYWCGLDIKHDPKRNKWHRWSGRLWDEATASHISRDVEMVFTDIPKVEGENYSEGIPPSEVDKPSPKTYREIFLAWAARQRSLRKVSDTVGLLKSREAIWCDSEDFDTDPYLFNVANGVVDLRTGELLEHDRSLMCTQMAEVAFDKEATCPQWLRFLEMVQPDEQHRKYLQRLLGSTLAGEKSQIFVVHMGDGGNGKGVVLDSTHHIMGTYATTGQHETFTRKNGSGRIPADLASYDGKRMVVVDELNDSQKMDEALLKNVTGGGIIKAESKGQNPWEYKPKFTLHFRTNYMPDLPADPSTLRRFRLIKWPVTPTSQEWDTFKDKDHRTVDDFLLQEAPGILNWLVEGARDYLDNGLQTPPDLEVDALEALEAQDDFLAFMDECTHKTSDTARTKGSAIYDAFVAWCKKQNLDAPMSSRKLYDAVKKGKYKGRFEWEMYSGKFHFTNRALNIMD